MIIKGLYNLSFSSAGGGESPEHYNAKMKIVKELKYYDDVYYRVIKENLTLACGGGYKSEGINSLGFALYTDNLLKVLEGK